MNFKKSLVVFAAISLMSLMSGCFFNVAPSDTRGPDSNTSTTQVSTNTLSAGSFSCSGSIPSEVTVVSGVPVNVNVLGSGGFSPYNFPGESATFFPNGTIARSYSNSTSSSIVVYDQLTIEDNEGNETTCTFPVTVQPESSPSNLTCTVGSSVTTVAVNGAVNYTVTSSGGVGTRTYGSFQPGTSGSFLVPFNPATGTAQVAYSTTGQQTASITVSDSAGNSAGCSTQVMVIPAPSLSVAVSPASSQPLGNPFTLTASPVNFINPPTSYTFTPSSSGVNVSQSSPSSPIAQVTSSSVTSFSVAVVASNANETASYTVNLNYTSPGLSCSLTYPSGTYYPNQLVTFSVSANTGEPLQIYFAQADDGSGYFLNSNVFVTFSSPGTKTVSVRARSAITGQLCNQGALVQSSIAISPVSSLSCTASTNINPSGFGQPVRATVRPTPNNGFVRITNIAISPSAVGAFNILPNGLQADLIVFSTGNFTLTYRIFDPISGATASCTSQQNILP